MALPGYLEDTAKDYAKQATATYKAPIETSTFTGGLDAAGVRAGGPGITGINNAPAIKMKTKEIFLMWLMFFIIFPIQ